MKHASSGNLTHHALRHTLLHGRGVSRPMSFAVSGRPYAVSSSPVHGQTVARVWDLRDGVQVHELRRLGDPASKVEAIDVIASTDDVFNTRPPCGSA